MLLRFDILTDPDIDAVHAGIIPTPRPRPEGVSYMTPEILPEGDPANTEFFPVSDDGGGGSDGGSDGGGGGGKGGGKGGDKGNNGKKPA